MYTVMLTSRTRGYVVNRLVHILREHGVPLSTAHDLASRVAEGRPAAIVFHSRDRADQFAEQARQVCVDVSIGETAVAS